MDTLKKPSLVGNLSAREARRRAARTWYNSQMRRREDDWGDPALVHDEEHDLFRFRDGKFAFSRDWANWPLLRKRGG